MPRVAFVSAFGDLPGAGVLMKDHGVPAQLATCGFYIAPVDEPSSLYDTHPEPRVSAKTSKAAFDLVRTALSVASVQLAKALGDGIYEDSEIGFHTKLTAKELAKALRADGFRISSFAWDKAATGFLGHAKKPWPMFEALLEDGYDVAMLIEGLDGIRTTSKPTAALRTTIARRIARHRNRRMLEEILEDLGVTPR